MTAATIAPPGPGEALTFPSDDEWTSADREAAGGEGWGIFDCDGSDNGRTQLQAFDDGGMHVDDTAAWRHVVEHARAGSPLHRKALDVVEKHNATEAACIRRSFGS